MACSGAEPAVLAIALALAGCDRQPKDRDAESQTPADRTVYWVTARDAFAAGDLNADGVEDFAGLCSDPEVGARDASFCAFDGARFGLLWRQPGFAAAEAYASRVALVGKRAVLITPGAEVRVHDAATGAPGARAKLSDRAQEICTPSRHAGMVWIETADGRGSLLDPKSATLRDEPRPPECPKRSAQQGTLALCQAMANERCAGLDVPPKVESFMPMESMRSGDRVVTLGNHSPGTSYPMLVGFDAATKSLRWQRPLFPGDVLAGPATLPNGADLSGNLFVSHYDKDGQHLIGIDATTGKTLWDVSSPSLFTLRTSSTRVYVMRWTRLDVRDGTDGRLLGGVGER
jgi:hypothetical protein